MKPVDRFKNTYSRAPVDRLFRMEFYIWQEALDRWKEEGWDGSYEQFRYDDIGGFYLDQINSVGLNFLGWTEAPVFPYYEEEVVKRDDKYEYYRLLTGEIRRYPIGGRTAVMPQFISSPVESREDWNNTVKAKLNPDTPERWAQFNAADLLRLKKRAEEGEALFVARTIGGYMYLRSLCGPSNLPYLFYDDPELVHDMMRTWLNLSLTCLMRIQDFIPFYELYMGEDIAYKGAPLISPQMAEEFLMPYYRELFQTLKGRQKQFMHIELDSDGNPDQLLPLYMKNGVTALSPCEVAAGADVLSLGEKYPELVLRGGINKVVLGQGKDAIARELERVIPAMKKRGRYIPMCDHGVPPDVSYENYLYYRQTITEMD